MKVFIRIRSYTWISQAFFSNQLGKNLEKATKIKNHDEGKKFNLSPEKMSELTHFRCKEGDSVLELCN